MGYDPIDTNENDSTADRQLTGIVSASLGSATVDNGKEVPGVSTSSSISPGFGTWTQISADRPSVLFIEAVVETDGTDNGEVRVEIDESGGTTADWFARVAHINATLGASAQTFDQVEIPLQPGAQFRVVNQSDPNTANSIVETREFVQ